MPAKSPEPRRERSASDLFPGNGERQRLEHEIEELKRRCAAAERANAAKSLFLAR